MGEFMHKERSRARWLAERVSDRLTRRIGARMGEIWPQYYVSEFPRSGGTWLGNMLADYLRCASPGVSIFPIGCRAVLHNHWKYHPKLKRVVYLMRDGRDVSVSMYFFRLRHVRTPGSATHKINSRIFREVLGEGYDPDDTLGNLPRMIEHDFANSCGAGKYNWAEHVTMWIGDEPRPQILYMTYEELLADTVAAVTKCLRHVAQTEPDARLVERSVRHYTMSNVTGREPGQEDRKSFVRKGVVGDWRNHFTRETAVLFDGLAGEALVEAGYEKDRGWVDRYEYPSR